MRSAALVNSLRGKGHPSAEGGQPRKMKSIPRGREGGKSTLEAGYGGSYEIGGASHLRNKSEPLI